MAEENRSVTEENKNTEPESKNFIENFIDEDLKEGRVKEIKTRFPPEPNGYLHIGHAKSILLNYGIAKEYNGTFNLRFDDTNPVKEKTEFVESIRKDVEWLGADFENRMFFASDYFPIMYEKAVFLIQKGKAFVDDLTAEEIREYRGDYNTPGKESPYRNRSMRDPILYRVSHMSHHNTGDEWCIYPMYDFAHPIEDAVEGISHSLCTLEFEDHRPLYDWVVKECEFPYPPRQIEFAKLYLTNVVTGKRYIKKLVEDQVVDGWDDPRLVTIAALRRRGYTKESLAQFVKLSGISKAQSSSDYSLLEYCIREDLKLKKPRYMAILDPIKLIIDNYEGEGEVLSIPNNLENEALGEREVHFSKELYIERDDFMPDPPKKYKRLTMENEVRLMGAYFVKAVSYECDEEGNVTVVHCTYDPATKSGSGFTERKAKGTIHWVDAKTAFTAEVRLYEQLIDEEKGKLNEDGSLNFNPNSLTVKDCYLEKILESAEPLESFQFVRNGYFCVDCKDSTEGHPIFNRIVSLKSSFKMN